MINKYRHQQAQRLRDQRRKETHKKALSKKTGLFYGQPNIKG